MKDYESIFILSPGTDEAESEKISVRMQEVIKGNGGEVVKVEKWGKRKLAYTVRKHKKGEYVLLQFRGGAMTVAELERNYKMTEAVIKYLTVLIGKEMLAHQARVEAAEAAAAKAEAEKPAVEEVSEPVEQAETGTEG